MSPSVFIDRSLALNHILEILPDAVTALKKLTGKYRIFLVGRAPDTQPVTAGEEIITALFQNEKIPVSYLQVSAIRDEEFRSGAERTASRIQQTAVEQELDLKHSFIIGDHRFNSLTADKLGVHYLHILTGEGFSNIAGISKNHFLFHRTSDASDWILSHGKGMEDINRQLNNCARMIQSGSVVAFPTETVYGLGADAFNQSAIQRLYKIKKRPASDPLIVHVSDIGQVSEIASVVPPKAGLLMEKLWPGPLTVVLPKQSTVPDVVTAGHSSVAVRLPAHPIAAELIRLSKTPIAAPSANLFGCTSPTTASHVRDQLEGRYDALIDGGACRVGVESTVISFIGPNPVILRPGGISRTEIETIIGPVETAAGQAPPTPESPGLLENHYAPNTPMLLFEEIPNEYRQAADVGVLIFDRTDLNFVGPAEILSIDGDSREIAMNLYAAMRRLDSMGLRCLVAQRVPEDGLGAAVNNRLEKASQTNPDQLG